MSAYISERELSKLRWRCRRGLLENDLFVERYLERLGVQVTASQMQGLYVLMDLSDNDLLDLLLGRVPLNAEAGSETAAVLAEMRQSA